MRTTDRSPAALRSSTSRVIKRGLWRAFIPLVLMWGMALALHFANKPSDAKSFFVSGIIVAAVAGFSVIYDVESWSLAKQSAVHFGSMVVTVLPCLLLSGWFPISEPVDALVILGYFLVTGAVVWSVMYLIFAKLLNRSTQEVHEDVS